MTEEKAKPKPPWVWDQLDEETRRDTWQRFAQWVDWLQETYEPWLVLPPCWPLHEALRVELAMFWYWHRYVMTSTANPPEGVRWHNEFRRSAAAWRELANCSHEEPVHYRRQLAEQRRGRHQEYLNQAIAAGGDAGWRV